MNIDALRAAATAWVALAPADDEPALVTQMLADGDDAALREHFGATLDFGTGGMRGRMGPGTNRMNRVMIRRVTSALGHVLATVRPGAREQGVAIAYDARHRSAAFAEEAALVLAAAGFVVHLAPTPQPTPVLGFATTFLGAAAGIIVTASHNPAADNGYKVFDWRGAQIVEPFDVDVCGHMLASDAPIAVADEPTRARMVRSWPSDLLGAYHAGVQRVRVRKAAPLRIVYTPVHGVGGIPAQRALRDAGYEHVLPVPEQLEPDARFPTVPFPNPEESGVLSLAISLAAREHANLILANDPDADRLAVAIPDRRGGWRQLSGNQVGVLLANDLLSRDRRSEQDLVATTIVSTAMLARIAARYGARCVETLTGFKWIAQAALAHEAAGGRFRFGVEESIGYTAGTLVRDKDGISTAVLVADLASSWHARGLSLADALQSLYQTHGLHVSRPVSLKRAGLDGLAEIRAAMRHLRANPPAALGGRAVVGSRDVLNRVGTRADGSTYALDLPASDVLAFELEDGSRALIRPSGTEPKIKLYLEAREQLADAEAWEDAEERVGPALVEIEKDLRAAAGL
jgi:phosphomannomutase